MRKLFLLILYGISAGLFTRFFSDPLYFILLILFLGGLAVLVFEGRWFHSGSGLKDIFWLISFFLWLTDIFGFIANGLNFTLGIFLTFIVTFLILWAGLPRFGRRRLLIYSFTAALIICEFFWAAAFLPFGYLTLAGLVFVIFYLIWTILHGYLEGILDKKIIFKNLAFGAVLIVILFLSARWQP